MQCLRRVLVAAVIATSAALLLAVAFLGLGRQLARLNVRLWQVDPSDRVAKEELLLRMYRIAGVVVIIGVGVWLTTS